MIQKLSKLHGRLRALRRRRRLVRWSTGYSALALALLWLLAALFVADWRLNMDRVQRILAMAICAATLAWAFRRFTLPWLGFQETELDMALMVEKQKQIDTDVVAAIQFESPEAPQWGSVVLEEAVIEQTARLGERLDVTEGIPRDPLRRRATALVVTAALLGVGIWQFPEYARVFFNRLLLRSAHYPTRTQILSVAVAFRNHRQQVELGGWTTASVKVPHGEPIRFEVTAAGDLPEAGEISMRTVRRRLASTAALSPAAPPSENRDSLTYTSQIQPLPDSVVFTIALGDAYTEPATLELVPLPVVDVQLEAALPAYAADKESEGPNPLGMRQIVVLEGSRVTVRLVSDKPLREAYLSIEGHQSPLVMARDPSGPGSAGQDWWKLEPAGTPLAKVREAIRYTVQATDTDGLQPDPPIQGVIRTRPDQPPRISASIVTKWVLPKARPTVMYTAGDDFGLAQIAVVPEVIRPNGTTEQRDEIIIYRLAQGQAPQRSIQEAGRLDLAPLKLVKGDQLKISIRATDYRGEDPGESSLSEPLVFQVTDEAGILAAISEADKESARQLKIMIERQIDVGEGR